MFDNIDDKMNMGIEVLGFSCAACNELKKCGITTVGELSFLIDMKLIGDEKVLNKEQSVDTDLRQNERGNSISLREAILKVFEIAHDKPFDCKTMRDKLLLRFGKRVSAKKNSVKCALNELVRKGIIERTPSGDYVMPSRTRSNDSDSKCETTQASTSRRNNVSQYEDLFLESEVFNGFLEKHIGKEFEFRYKSNRINSDKRWRREKLWAYDNNYFYVERMYSSNRRVMYRKDRVVDFREVTRQSGQIVDLNVSKGWGLKN